MNQAPVPDVPAGDLRQVGGISVAPDAVISFPEGMPGFEASRAFVLLSSPDMEPLRHLRAVSGAEASFVVVDPRRVLPGYRCRLGPTEREKLGASEGGDLLWLAILAIEPDGTAVANLRAPVVINPRTMTGLQVMPHRCLYALRHVVTEIG